MFLLECKVHVLEIKQPLSVIASIITIAGKREIYTVSVRQLPLQILRKCEKVKGDIFFQPNIFENLLQTPDRVTPLHAFSDIGVIIEEKCLKMALKYSLDSVKI